MKQSDELTAFKQIMEVLNDSNGSPLPDSTLPVALILKFSHFPAS